MTQLTCERELAGCVSIDNFAQLSSIMYPKTAQAGTHLFWEGEDAGHLYYIRSGLVKLKKTTEEGRDFISTFAHKGDLIMDGAGTDETTHLYNAEVIEDADIGVIQKRDLEILLHRNGEFAVEFMAWMGVMQQRAQSKFRDLLMYGKPGALASTIIRLCNTYGVATAEGIRIDIKLTNAELADMIGATRESVNRMLSEWKTQGTLGAKQGKLIVKQLKDLRAVCGCPAAPACPNEICRI